MIHDIKDTICAISTPGGIGGIAVIRISGDKAFEIADSVWQGKSLALARTHTAHLGYVLDSDGARLDQAVATVYVAPASFTGENVVEISVHGSRYVQQALLSSLITHGARLADPGEFTRRAFISGKIDLAQAEAVADIIASESKAAQRIALSHMKGNYSSRLKTLRQELIDLASLLELELDFSEEEVEFASRTRLTKLANEISAEINRLASSFALGNAIKNGIPVAIIGATNAGKSSILNRLLGEERAIVSDIHGTTRDVIEGNITIGHYSYRLMDTAGIRTTNDTIERLGIERSHAAMQQARIILYIIDSAAPEAIDVPQTDATIFVVVNKTDLPPHPTLANNLKEITGAHPDAKIFSISALTGQGIDSLITALDQVSSTGTDYPEATLVTNVRHFEALLQAGESIRRAISGLAADLSGELIAQDIRLTIHHLGSILGTITTTDLLTTIFSRFCVGK